VRVVLAMLAVVKVVLVNGRRGILIRHRLSHAYWRLGKEELGGERGSGEGDLGSKSLGA
jgi:hypothetical protein